MDLNNERKNCVFFLNRHSESYITWEELFARCLM
jgi:hypothetical protein